MADWESSRTDKRPEFEKYAVRTWIQIFLLQKMRIFQLQLTRFHPSTGFHDQSGLFILFSFQNKQIRKKLFNLKGRKLSMDLQTELPAEAHPAEGY
jgi:hypothetical protein